MSFNTATIATETQAKATNPFATVPGGTPMREMQAIACERRQSPYAESTSRPNCAVAAATTTAPFGFGVSSRGSSTSGPLRSSWHLRWHNHHGLRERCDLCVCGDRVCDLHSFAHVSVSSVCSCVPVKFTPASFPSFAVIGTRTPACLKNTPNK